MVGTTSAFGGELPLAGLIVDQQSALLAEGCVAAGSAKCTFGTGAFLLANTGAEASRSGHGLTTSVAWRTRAGTQYCLDGQVYTAASAIRWIRNLGLIDSAIELDDACAEESGGVLFVPALAGLAAPWWRADALASFSGLSLATSRGALVRAVVEGIAAQVAELVRVFEADLGAPIASLRVDGGLTNSRALMQAQADLLQVPVEVYPSAHATPLGAAALAAPGTAAPPRAGRRPAPWTPSASFVPRWSADRAAELIQPVADAAMATVPGGAGR